MGNITRSEAAYRLKLVNSAVNIAVSSVREGFWKQACTAVEQAIELLERLQLHLEEAAETEPPEPVGSLKYGTPPTMESERARQRPPIPTRHDHTPVRPVIIVPPDMQPQAQPPRAKTVPRPAVRPVIVTPPPPVQQLEETKTFDLSLICGQLANYQRVQQDPSTQTDWEMTEAFDRLDHATRDKVTAKYNATKQPVTLSDL